MQATKQVDKLSANNLLLVLLLISFIVVGATGLIAKTLITGLVRDTKVLSAENKANKNLDTDLQAAPDLVTSYQGLGPKAAVLADALPTDSNFPGLIVALENMALDSNLSLKSVAPSFGLAAAPAMASTASGTPAATSIEAPKPATYGFTISFDGSYLSLQKLLGDLEIYDRPMRVQSVKLAGTGSALSGTIDVQTYYQAKATLPVAKETIK